MVANAVDVMAALITWFRLVCSGDIELNPGPLSEEDLLAFTSLLSQSLTLTDIVMNGLAGAHTEDSIRDKGWNNEKVNILQQLDIGMEILPIIILCQTKPNSGYTLPKVGRTYNNVERTYRGLFVYNYHG